MTGPSETVGCVTITDPLLGGAGRSSIGIEEEIEGTAGGGAAGAGIGLKGTCLILIGGEVSAGAAGIVGNAGPGKYLILFEVLELASGDVE